MAPQVIEPPSVALCIPTFQRADCLQTLLESVSLQQPPFSEVIISDDCSTDRTSEVVRSFRGRIPGLVYHRCAENTGLDANFRTVAALSSSTFIWFMGDDDRLRSGAVEAFFRTIREFPQVMGITFAAVDYDSQLVNPTGLKAPPPTQLVIGARQLFSQHVHLLGFMSTMVVRRDAWDAVSQERLGAFDNLYSQVHRLGALLGEDGHWLISSELTVDYRSDNDQFKTSSGGDLPRMMRDAEAYKAIIEDLFPNCPKSRFAASDLILRSHILSRVRNGKLTKSYSWPAAIAALAHVYSSHRFFWMMVVPTLLTPPWLLRTARSLFRSLSPSSGAARARAFSKA